MKQFFCQRDITVCDCLPRRISYLPNICMDNEIMPKYEINT